MAHQKHQPRQDAGVPVKQAVGPAAQVAPWISHQEGVAFLERQQAIQHDTLGHQIGCGNRRCIVHVALQTCGDQARGAKARSSPMARRTSGMMRGSITSGRTMSTRA